MSNFEKKMNFFSTYFFILRIFFLNSDTVPFSRCIRDSKGNGLETALPLLQIPSNVYWQHRKIGQLAKNEIFIFFSLKFSHNMLTRSNFKEQQFCNF